MNDKIEHLTNILQNSDNIVFFGGAGVSTESGIPDFRSQDGLYNMRYKYPPETILSRSFFNKNTDEFYRFYRDKLLAPMLNVKPNDAHNALAALEKHGKLKAVVTQNVDGLHQMAGSVNVFELHGSRRDYYCIECSKDYPLDAIVQDTAEVPLCGCGGVIRPDVVLFEEPLSQYVLEGATGAIQEAEVLIVGGTSLNVYPAAGLIEYYGGDKLALINKSETSYDSRANLVIRESIGKALGAAVRAALESL